MAETRTGVQWQDALVALSATVMSVVVVGVLYWAQVILIPVALAVFLAFLLNPLVRAFQRVGLGRIPSVLIVVTLTGLLLAVLGWLVARQVSALLVELPAHTSNIKEKVKTLRELGEGTEDLGKMVDEVGKALKSKPAPGQEAEKLDELDAGKPRAVVVQPESPAWLARLPGYLGSALETAGGLALALVLLIFMLLGREDLRDRFLRLIGHARLPSTTRAVDEAGVRISRYLLMQAIVNGSYGLVLGIGLFVIGVDYAALWGFLAAVLRYVPYVGPWIAALFPLTLSLAMFEGWWELLAVVTLFLVLELVSNNVMEPWLYGQSMGVSEVALLVAAAFWAFLWGPIGLVLSAPLTVCLVVLGRYVPQLEFLTIVLGDEPALAPDHRYYQRLLARDQDEAASVVLGQLETIPRDEVYDALLIPALNYTLRDRQRDELNEADEQFIFKVTRDILTDLGPLDEDAAPLSAPPAQPSSDASAIGRVTVMGCCAREEADELALEMLGQLLDPKRWDLKIVPAETLTSEIVAQAVETRPALIVIAALPPGGMAHVRYLCKRLRARFADIKIIAGRWGLQTDVQENEERLREAGVDLVVTGLLKTRTQMDSWHPVLASVGAAVPGEAGIREPHRQAG